MNVKGKVAVLTGGASGIGLALCTRFPQAGAHVILSDLTKEHASVTNVPVQGHLPPLVARPAGAGCPLLTPFIWRQGLVKFVRLTWASV